MAKRTIGTDRLIDGVKIDNLPNDTNAELTLKADITYVNSQDASLQSQITTNTNNISSLSSTKVDKTTTINGQDLSTNRTFTQDDIGDGITYKQYSQTEKTKLAGIEAGAEVNNISNVNATDLTDGGDTSLHSHDGRYYTESEVDTLLNGKEDTLGYNPLQSIVAGTNVTIDNTDQLNPIISASGGGAVDSVNGQTGVVVLDADDIVEGTTNKYLSATDKTDLTDGGDSSLHYHSSDRDRANHTGEQAISTITNLQTTLNGKANLTGATFTGTISATNLSGTNTGDQTNITGNAGTATALQTARTIGGVSFDGTTNINLPGVNTTGNQNTTGTASNVTGTVAVANGGTGKTTVTTNSYLKGNGTGVLTERTYAEVKTDLSLNNVDNTSDATKNSAVATLTNKTINLTSNTLTGTTAQFNTALSDGDFATLAGTETLTNKTIALGSNTISGTKAQFDTACSDGNFVYTDGDQTIAGIKTFSSSPIVPTPTTDMQVATKKYVDDNAGGGGSNPIYQTYIAGEQTTGLIGRFISKGIQTIAGVKISLSTLPTGANFSVDVRKNGTATTNSIFTSDTPISITTSQGATNGIYITTGTAIDNGSLVENDVLYFYITQIGSTLSGTNLEIVAY